VLVSIQDICAIFGAVVVIAGLNYTFIKSLFKPIVDKLTSHDDTLTDIQNSVISTNLKVARMEGYMAYQNGSKAGVDPPQLPTVPEIAEDVEKEKGNIPTHGG
jgi:hypothetical protein